MYREDSTESLSDRYSAIRPVDPQTHSLRACLRDTLDNLLLSIYGDEAERDGAVEDLASVEICLHGLSLGRKPKSLPFTFTPTIAMSKVILGMRPQGYQKTDAYRDSIRRLFFMLHVEWHWERYGALARSILNTGDCRLAVEAVMSGESSVDPQTI
ncbi:MAG TPA: hypothetical protein VFE17_04315 [Candidatus Baltobacteraceae bacterium]|nr:hypothetical protein [Candidatus Baltobacteraceae bacterium]